MRRFDKKLNIERANLLAEQRYLQSKDNIIKESEYYSLEDVDKETDPSELRFKLITSYGYRPDALNQKYNSEMERLTDLKNIVKDEMRKRGYPEKTIDEISGDLKRRAFDAASDRLSKTQDWDVDSKKKYGDMQYTTMSHINPEIKKEIENVGKNFGFNTFIKKYVGGPDSTPVLKIYFGTDDKVNEYNYIFSYNIEPDRYNYYSLKTDYVKPNGFGRRMLNLIEKIQKEELIYSPK